MQLNSQVNVQAAQSEIRQQGRTRLANFLNSDDLSALCREVDAINQWNLVSRLQGRHLDLDAQAMQGISSAQRQEFYRRLAEEPGFTYLFENYPIYDKWHSGALKATTPQLAKVFTLLNSAPVLQLMRELLDAPDIGFADAQLTRYRAGHFLDKHDDAVEGKSRVAAYVLSLSHGWQPQWGGALEFYHPDGSVSERFLPQLNTLSLFAVPVPHAVTRVKADIQAHRLSITGWFRCGEDPGP